MPAPSLVVPAAEASHEGAAAEAAAHHADKEDETSMKEAAAVPAPLPSQPGNTSSGAHTAHSLVRGMRARTRAQC